jgi:hypothetical protein
MIPFAMFSNFSDDLLFSSRGVGDDVKVLIARELWAA